MKKMFEKSSEKSTEPVLRRADILLLAGIAVFAALLFLFFLRKDLSLGTPMLEISQGGTVVGLYPLTEDRVIPIGEGNVCEISGGTVRMTEADCPDHSCIRSRAIDARGGTIICLPNRVVLRIIDGKGGVPDAVAE